MALIADAALDAGLEYVRTNGTRLYYCSAEPTSAATAISLALASKATVTLGAVGDRSPTGRKFTVPAVTDGVVSGNGTITHWGLVNGATGTILAAAGQLSASKAIVTGSPLTSDAFDIGFPDAVSV